MGVAIAAGGPGALFWMWVSALLGMMTLYAENVPLRPAPAGPGAFGVHTPGRALGRQLAWLYGAGCCLSSLAMGNMAQTNAAAAALEELGIPPWAAAVGMGALAFFAARGGLAWG